MNKETWLIAYSFARLRYSQMTIRMPSDLIEPVKIAAKIAKENRFGYGSSTSYKGSQKVFKLMVSKGYIWLNGWVYQPEKW